MGQLNIFDKEEKDTLDDIVGKSMEEKPKEKIATSNDKKNYGIIKKDYSIIIDSFEGTQLENMFYGTRNVTIPHEILQQLNPVDILSIYYATGKIKKNPSKHSEFKENYTTFEDLIKSLNKVSYGNTFRFAVLKNSDVNPLPHGPGKLQERMSALDGDLKERFVESFMKDYRPPIHKGGDWPDPIYEGGTRDGPISAKNKKGIYGKELFETIKYRYERNIQNVKGI